MLFRSDSIVQRNAPDANQGRAFAQFETRFQLAWVAAGIVPVLIHFPGELGFAIVGALAAFAMVTYLASMRRVRQGLPLPDPITTRAKRELGRRRARRHPASTPGVSRLPGSSRPPLAPPASDGPLGRPSPFADPPR